MDRRPVIWPEPEEWKVVEPTGQAQLTLDEIAARLEWSVETVKTRLRAGLVNLRGQLQSLIEKGPV